MTDSGSEMTIKPFGLWTSLLLEGLDWKVIVNLLTLLFHAHESSVSQIVVQMCWRTCEGLIFVFSEDKAFNGPSVLPQDRW